MKREELEELHYIAHIANLPSIYARGILSHERARSIEHRSVADEQVRDRRARVVVPRGRRLHDYANLYFHARNPMMYRRHNDHGSLCVLKVSTDVLDLAGVIITDSNASSDYVRFAAAPGGLSIVDRALAFAADWRHADYFEFRRRRSVRCAEVLVPDGVAPQFLGGFYVSCEQSRALAQATLGGKATTVEVVVDGHLFFQ